MINNNKLKEWSESYWNQIRRNIGIFNINEQEKLRTTKIGIFGLGGLGGSLAEQLSRAGCEEFIICDNEKFEETNLNRQLCTRDDIGKYKVDVIEDFIRKINPEIKVIKFYEVNKNNISKVLQDISIVALTLDDSLTSVLIARECLKEQIPIIESWGIPYLCAWWFTSESIDYETFYGLETHNLTIDDIQKSQSTILKIRDAFLKKLLKFPHIIEFYDREIGNLKAMIFGDLPLISISPIVRITASYLAFEIIFAGILKLKKMIIAPAIIGYDYLRMQSFELDFSENKNK